ncbi:MAG TPA: hypothetical protein DCW74_19700 [Alteromonas australica]|uniref:Uncharacterized protein n=1 Tax=Alteromonas australica TaxID=589873 RepID=A0A350P9I1_9ALTE|nr:hypothetical protein [Alteromonas australica]
MLKPGKKIRSHGGNFVYEILGPVCILYDREELPWPCCSLKWRGKQPYWNRQGKRFVPDLAASRCGAYAVSAQDLWGNSWEQVLILYDQRLHKKEKEFWYWKGPACKSPPEYEEN